MYKNFLKLRYRKAAISFKTTKAYSTIQSLTMNTSKIPKSKPR